MPPFLVAGDNVAYLLPDGTELFSNLTFSIMPNQRVALVGRNGCGKSSFAQLLSDDHSPAPGTLVRHGTAALVEQDPVPPPTLRAVDYLEVGEKYDALKRSERGEATVEDVALIEDDWTFEAALQSAFDQVGIGHIPPEHLLAHLSGGEWLRLRLLAALRTSPDLLILDEPSNHLDQTGRKWLEDWLRNAPCAWLLISHDRRLLDLPHEIWELTSTGLDFFGGNFDQYTTEKTAQQQAAIGLVNHEKKTEKHLMRDQQMARERHERRAAKGRRTRSKGDQPKFVLDGRKARSEHTASRLSNIREARLSASANRLDAARARVKDTLTVQFDADASSVAPHRTILSLEKVSFGYGSRRLFTDFNFSLKGPARIHLAGGNGSGKSTLLDLIVGRREPMSGSAIGHVPIGYLLQKSKSSRDETVVERCLAYRPNWPETEIRTKLARAGLRRDKALCALDALSAGEQVRAELIRLLTCPDPAQLLLLDEPSNHLDLDALEALETALSGYRGALIFTSHDPVFVKNMNITDVVTLPAS